MAFLPTDVFTSWSEDGTDITVPILSILDLTAATADATTGDARQVVWSLSKTAFDWYNGLATKPTAIKVEYNPGSLQSVNSTTFPGTVKASITITAYLDFPEDTVTAEPA